MRLMTILLSIGLLIMAAGSAQAQDSQPASQLADLRAAAQARLDHLDASLARAAQELSSAGLTGPEARRVLRKLYQSCPEALDVATVDIQGRMITMEPKAYRHFEGSDISGQEQVARVLGGTGPAMSQVFRTVEGVEAVDLERPVLDAGGGQLGSVSLLFRPDVLLHSAVQGLRDGTGHTPEVWALDAQGRIIFDQDPNEINRNLFSDPLYQDYPELLSLGRLMLAQPAGQGGYSFMARGSNTLVRKRCQWVSVSLHGTWWRLALTTVAE